MLRLQLPTTRRSTKELGRDRRTVSHPRLHKFRGPRARRRSRALFRPSPWLAQYGYRHLIGINIAFQHPTDVGPIRYEYGDLTHTRFTAGRFDVITCLSVIEHGVDPRAYFREMGRLLRPGGLLITSTDYFEPQVDAHGKHAFGVPIRIFSEREIRQAFGLAAPYGLQPTGPIDLRCQERAVRWEEHRLGLYIPHVHAPQARQMKRG